MGKSSVRECHHLLVEIEVGQDENIHGIIDSSK